MTKPDRPRCRGITKAGTPCSRYALDGSEFCIAHAERKEKEARGFGGPQEGSGRPKLPTISERLQAKLEERADDIIDKLFDGLEAQTAKVVGNGKSAHLEFHEDRGEILKTIREILDRTGGRPKQSSEFTGHVEHRNGDALNHQIDQEIERLVDQRAAEMLQDERNLLKIQELTEELAREKLGEGHG